jgi:hypothetical protein
LFVRRFFIPVTAGKPVRVQVNPDKLHSSLLKNLLVRSNSGILDHASMRGTDPVGISPQ